MRDAARDARFGRFCTYFLAIEWILFGSMHFSMHDATVAQAPGYLPLRDHLVVVSGIWEVATGVLILVPELRRWAAWSSLALLIVLIPAMYNILAFDSAVADSYRAVFRVVLLPNNIFMGICSVFLIRHWRATLQPLDAAPPARRAPRADWSAEPVTLLVPGLLLMANCAGFLAVGVGAPGNFGTAGLWAMGCIASGALIGFLFGVPRINPLAQMEGEFVHNQNIEAVSDWLTKILVGVGLVNFQAIGAFTTRMSTYLAEGTGTHTSFAMGLIVYFFVIGIIQGYILTRLFLAKPFQMPRGTTRRPRTKVDGSPPADGTTG